MTALDGRLRSGFWRFEDGCRPSHPATYLAVARARHDQEDGARTLVIKAPEPHVSRKTFSSSQMHTL